jgi:hypothetical protein
MIRPVTCVCLLMAAGSGLYLYQAKHQAQLLDREITRTMTEVGRLRQRINVLRADYQLEQDPQTLAELTQQYLDGLKPTDPGQFTTWTELAKLLPPIPPPPAPDAPPPAPAAEVAASEAVPAERLELPRQVVVAAPAHAEAAKTELTQARPTTTRSSVRPVGTATWPALAATPPAATTAVSRLASRPPVGLARPTPATGLPTLAAAGTPTAHLPPPVSLAPVPVAAKVAALRPQPPVLFASRSNAYAPPAAFAPRSYLQTTPEAPAMPLVASALGMARAMLAPVAASPANAATPIATRYPAGNLQ